MTHIGFDQGAMSNMAHLPSSVEPGDSVDPDSGRFEPPSPVFWAARVAIGQLIVYLFSLGCILLRGRGMVHARLLFGVTIAL